MDTTKHNHVRTRGTVEKNSDLMGNQESGNAIDNKPNARSNAISKLIRLRMKRKAENQDSMGFARKRRPYNIPVPPTPPAREINASTMKFLFEKRLKYSDVKEERIVIPKAFAENFMPTLESKEGIYMFMDDMVAVKTWMFRYRYWPNNSSRVYVLEHTGELVKAYGLQVADFIMVYKDIESQSFAIKTRKSNANEDYELSLNTSNPLPILQDNVVPNSDESGSNSCSPKCISSTSTKASTKTSEYSGGLKNFPFHLLEVDISELPEY